MGGCTQLQLLMRIGGENTLRSLAAVPRVARDEELVRLIINTYVSIIKRKQ